MFNGPTGLTLPPLGSLNTTSSTRAASQRAGALLPQLPPIQTSSHSRSSPALAQRSGSWAQVEASLPPHSPLPELTPSSTPSTTSSSLSSYGGCGNDDYGSLVTPNFSSILRPVQPHGLRRMPSIESFNSSFHPQSSRPFQSNHSRHSSGTSDDDSWGIGPSSRSRSPQDSGYSTTHSHSRNGFAPLSRSSLASGLDTCSPQFLPNKLLNPSFPELSTSMIPPSSRRGYSSSYDDDDGYPAFSSGMSTSSSRLPSFSDRPAKSSNARLGHSASYSGGFASGTLRPSASRSDLSLLRGNQSPMGSHTSSLTLPSLPPLDLPGSSTYSRRPLGKNASYAGLTRFEGSGW